MSCEPASRRVATASLPERSRGETNRAHSAWWLVPVPLCVVMAGAFVLRLGVNVPFYDEWHLPALLQKADTGTLGWADLAQQHNEHRIVVPRLVMVGLARLTSWNVKAQMLFTAVHLSLLLLLLYVQAAKDYGFSWGRAPAWFAWIPLLVLNWRQYENLTWGFQIGLTLPLTACSIAFFLLVRAAEARTTATWAATFVPAVLAGAGASFSGPMGLLSWPLGLGLLMGVPWRSRRRERSVLAWAVAGAAAVWLYFHDYHSPSHHSALAGASGLQVTRFLFSLLGAWATTAPGLALVAGVLLFAAMAGALTALAVGSRLRARLFWVAAAAMSLGTLGMVAWGRAGSPELATRSAYTTYSLFFVAAALPLVVESLGRSMRRIAVMAASLALGLGVANGYVIGWRTASANRAALLNLREALRDHCNRPNGDLAPLYENVGVIRSQIPYLERRRYSVFAAESDATCRVRPAVALATYRPGTVISFGIGGDARLYQGPGWSLPEEGFTWTDGPQATLRLLLDGPPRDATLAFTVPIANTEPGRLDRQRVVVSVNAALVGTVLVPGAGHYTLAVPGRLLREGENVLVLDLPDARLPATGGRRLAVALHTMQLGWAEP